MSHQSYPSFNYTPLQPGCIRVLRPAIELNGDLTWTMDAIQLGDDEPFDALSYVWGDQSQTLPFVCNSQEFRIHHNLSNALPYLAKRDSSRPIWIDALCINQRDEDEKAAQIRFMYRVYRRATQVWIWFGCATEKTSEAISFLPRLNYVLDMMDENFERPTFQWLGFPSSRDPLWEEVLEISCNGWFERLWIVQEALLAREIRVLRGNYEINWDTLTALATNLGNLMKLRDDPQAGFRTEAAGNREAGPKPVSSDPLVVGRSSDLIGVALSAFLRNDRSALSSWDLPSHLRMLQSEEVYDFIQWAPSFLPDDVRPLWDRYHDSTGCNLDTLVDDLLPFLIPGRRRRRTPWSEHSYSMPDRLPTDSLGALSLSVPDDRPIFLLDDGPPSESDDPPISVPDELPISVPDELPISVPDDPPISIPPDHIPALTKEAVWGSVIDVMQSLPSRDRAPALFDAMWHLLAGMSDNPAVFKDLMPQHFSQSDAMQMEFQRLSLGLDPGRVFRPLNFAMMLLWRTQLQSAYFESQAPDRPLVAIVVLEIVWTMTGFQACFDPRDRVFGTFGFFGETLPSELSLSHKMGLDELYSTFCQYLLAESASTPGVELTSWWPTLHRATLPGKRSSLPSWCPDFHQNVDDRYKQFDGTPSIYGKFCQPRFEAGTKRPIMIKRGVNWSEIRLRGRIFDSVSVLHSAIPIIPNLKEFPSMLMRSESLRMSVYRLAVWERDLAARVVEAPVGSIKPSNMFEAYWQTLVGNTKAAGAPLTRQDFVYFQTGLQRIRDLFDRVGAIKRLEDGTLVEEEDDFWTPSTPEEEDIYLFMMSPETSPFYPVFEAMLLGLGDNRPFTTTSGRFGYGRRSVEEGDALCIFDGSTTAHLVRRKDGGRPGAEVYRLVGEAFVHGMMYGEIDNLDVEEQDITLV